MRRPDAPCSPSRRRPSPDRGGRERIAYRDLGVEQLGAVYETLLDYEPRLQDDRPAAGGGRFRSG